MYDVNLRRINLNLLPVLQALLECKSVTRAGEQLALSQPATSSALRRLRRIFGDELLVLVGREMHLTPKAERLIEPLRILLLQLEETISPDTFDPLDWNGEFVIASADYFTLTILPDLIKVLEVEAPKLSVRVTSLEKDTKSRLSSDLVDLIVAPKNVMSEPNFMTRHLLDDEFVCIYCANRKVKPNTSDLDAYMGEKHLTTVLDYINLSSHSLNWSGSLDQLRETQDSGAYVPYYAVLPHLVVQTNYLAIIQKRLALKMQEQLPIEIGNLPVELDKLSFNMHWSPQMQGDLAHSWMRTIISRVCSKL